MTRHGRDGLLLSVSVSVAGYKLTISRGGVDREEEWASPYDLADRMRSLGAPLSIGGVQQLELTAIRKASITSH